MRPFRPTAMIAAFLFLAGCSTGSTIDALQSIKPSNEITSSIVRPVTPQATVGASAAAYPDASPAAIAALNEPDTIDTPAMQQVAMVAPQSRPAAPPASGPRPKVISQRFSDAKPMDFGKITPQHHLVHGVDVSRWQGDIDWARLRSQGANFAFIKATDGGDHLDPMFAKNWKGAADAGIKRGAYHFFYWCRTASSQADWFIRNVPKEAGALPPVIDVEWNHQSRCKQKLSPQLVREKMQVFMDRLERHYGQKPIIYVTPDFYDDNLKGAFNGYPYWLRSVAAHPSKRYPGREWAFWQYSGTGLSKGVKGEIDLNVFNGDVATWYRWLGRNVHGTAMARN
jgi:lysozyme